MNDAASESGTSRPGDLQSDLSEPDLSEPDLSHSEVLEPDLSLGESFDSYYRRDYRSLLGLAYVLTGSSSLAEDLVQDALTEAHRRWHRISTYDDVGAWVRRVLVNKSRSRFRKLRSEAKALTRVGSRAGETALPVEIETEVWAAVRALPNKQAHAVALFYWEDRSVADVAEILGCGTETIKTHLKRGRATLANRLESFEHVEPATPSQKRES